MSFRPGARLFQQSRMFFRQQQARQPFNRRYAATAADATAAGEQSAFSKFFNSPVGPKTVHFWAPIMKWGLVIAGISDSFRPASQISLQQNLALMCTGLIWTRWCFIIKPKNIFLASVNFFLFLTASTQVTRVLLWRASLKDGDVAEAVKEEARETKELGKGAVEDGERKVKEVAKN